MKQRIVWMLSAILLIGSMACEKPRNSKRNIKGSWKVASMQMPVGQFTHVAVLNSGDLYINTGVHSELRVEADDNLLPYLVTREANGKLELMDKPGVLLEPRSRVKYFLTAGGLESIAAVGKGNVIAQNLSAEKFSIVSDPMGDFTVRALTAGQVTINPGGEGSSYCTDPGALKIGMLHAKELKVRNNTNEKVIIAGGKIDLQEITINNEGSYEAAMVESTVAEVHVNGSGSVTIKATKSLIAHLSDYSGNVYYVGDPVITQTRQSEASGKLIQIHE